MKLEDLVARANDLIENGNRVLATKYSIPGAPDFVETAQFTAFRTSALSFLGRAFGEETPHYREFHDRVTSARPGDVKQGIGVLVASKEDLEGGWMRTTKGLLSAELFSDFLDMAGHLLTEGYKDAAAVIIGSVLEEHLRQLAQKHGVESTMEKAGEHILKKADQLNAELAKRSVYSVLDQKNITAHLDLRNKAAHGKYDEYTESQVKLMHSSVMDFTCRIPV